MGIFGKLINGKLEVLDWRKIFVVDGASVHSRDPEFLLSQGYKQIIYTSPEPKEGYVADNYTWEETETQLIQKWNHVEVIELEEKSELEVRIDDMNDTISMLTECVLEMSSMIYA